LTLLSSRTFEYLDRFLVTRDGLFIFVYLGSIIVAPSTVTLPRSSSLKKACDRNYRKTYLELLPLLDEVDMVFEDEFAYFIS